jgi:hypothetical protein
VEGNRQNRPAIRKANEGGILRTRISLLNRKAGPKRAGQDMLASYRIVQNCGMKKQEKAGKTFLHDCKNS